MTTNVSNLILEVGRKCNMQCDHCLRGPAENKTMSIETAIEAIDSFEYINQITFTGGEPMLYAKNIIKIIDYIIKNGKKVYGFYMATNGKFIDTSLLLKFAEFYAYCVENGGEDELCRIDLSNDQYHENVEIPTILKAFKFFGIRGNISSLINEGYAELYEMGSRNLKREHSFYIDTYANESTIDLVYVNARGFIYSDCDFSYKTQKELEKYRIKDIPEIIANACCEAA